MNTNFDMYQISFGEEYTNYSEYFTPLTYPSASYDTVYFDLAFSGMALPEMVWKNTYEPLFMNLTTMAATCDSDSGICSMPGTCAAQYELFSKYSFKIEFAENSTFVRVPLTAFAVDSIESGVDQCNVMVTGGAAAETSVYLGAMFF